MRIISQGLYSSLTTSNILNENKSTFCFIFDTSCILCTTTLYISIKLLIWFILNIFFFLAQRRCKPSLHLNFENDLLDKSDRNIQFYSTKVTLSENGTGVFTSLSRLTFWRFSNVEFRQGLYIVLSILSTAQTSDRQIIFTNDGLSSLDGPSISGAIEGKKFVFQLVTNARQETITIDKVSERLI